MTEKAPSGEADEGWHRLVDIPSRTLCRNRKFLFAEKDAIELDF